MSISNGSYSFRHVSVNTRKTSATDKKAKNSHECVLKDLFSKCCFGHHTVFWHFTSLIGLVVHLKCLPRCWELCKASDTCTAAQWDQPVTTLYTALCAFTCQRNSWRGSLQCNFKAFVNKKTKQNKNKWVRAFFANGLDIHDVLRTLTQ